MVALLAYLSVQSVAPVGLALASLLFGAWLGVLVDRHISRRRPRGKSSIVFQGVWLGIAAFMCLPWLMLVTGWWIKLPSFWHFQPHSKVVLKAETQPQSWYQHLTVKPGASVRLSLRYVNEGSTTAQNVMARIMLPRGLQPSAKDPLLLRGSDNDEWPLWHTDRGSPLHSGPATVFSRAQPLGAYAAGGGGNVLVWVRVSKKPPPQWHAGGSLRVRAEVWSEEETRVETEAILFVDGW